MVSKITYQGRRLLGTIMSCFMYKAPGIVIPGVGVCPMIKQESYNHPFSFLCSNV